MKKATRPNDVLALLAKTPHQTKYQMKKSTGLSYSRIHESAGALEKAGLIKAKVIGKSRTGFDIKAYSLTLDGFTTLTERTHTSETYEEDLAVWIENYKTLLPLITGKWDFFKRGGIVQELCHYLFSSRGMSVKNYTYNFYAERFVELSNEPKALLKVIKVLVGDKDLRKMALEILKTVGNNICLSANAIMESIFILEETKRGG